MWRDALAVAGKDLRIELRSKVAVNQIAPFALVVLLLFAFALDPDRGFLTEASPGLFWVAVLLSALIVVQRSASLEVADAGRDALRLSGLDPAGVFLGKAAASFVVLVLLEIALLGGIVLLYGASLGGWPVLVVGALTATVGLVSAGTIHGALASGLRVRETLLPLLFLPVVAPVMIGGTRAFAAALDGSVSEGWRWCGLLGTFAVAYTALGMLLFEPLLEDS
jgi:heme exporter protein B